MQKAIFDTFNANGTCSFITIQTRCVISQNVLDDRLRHANLGVVLGAVRLFLHLTEHMPHLHKDVHDRIKGEDSLSHTQLLLSHTPSKLYTHPWASSLSRFCISTKKSCALCVPVLQMWETFETPKKCMLTTEEPLRQGSGTTLGQISSLYSYDNQTYVHK